LEKLSDNNKNDRNPYCPDRITYQCTSGIGWTHSNARFGYRWDKCRASQNRGQYCPGSDSARDYSHAYRQYLASEKGKDVVILTSECGRFLVVILDHEIATDPCGRRIQLEAAIKGSSRFERKSRFEKGQSRSQTYRQVHWQECRKGFETYGTFTESRRSYRLAGCILGSAWGKQNYQCRSF
jgi:hypothetical protein